MAFKESGKSHFTWKKTRDTNAIDMKDDINIKIILQRLQSSST